MVEQKIVTLLDEKFQDPEFETYFLIELELKGGNRLEVYLDGDQGITLQKCQEISRYLEGHLDESLWLGEKYTLEVSSPGTKRPLKYPRQYHQHLDRKLEVKVAEEEDKTTTYQGRLTSVGENSIHLFWKERIKEGKKKRNVEIEKEIPFDIIKKAIVKLSFNKGK